MNKYRLRVKLSIAAVVFVMLYAWLLSATAFAATSPDTGVACTVYAKYSGKSEEVIKLHAKQVQKGMNPAQQAYYVGVAEGKILGFMHAVYHPTKEVAIHPSATYWYNLTGCTINQSI